MSNLFANCTITNAYRSKSASDPKQIIDGELRFSGTSSAGSTYIKIKNVGYTYYWDCEVTVSTGNHFYFGFERFDANKTSLSNNSTIYTIEITNTGTSRRRFSGSVDFSKTINGELTDTVALRILNGWSGSTDAANATATVHSLSLREVPTNSLVTIGVNKQGVMKADFFNELSVARICDDSVIEANTFIES